MERDRFTASRCEVVCFVFLFCGFTLAQPSCPRMCTCDYYASTHTINCDSQDFNELPDDIPEWTTELSFDGNYLTTLDTTGFRTTVYFEAFKIRYNEITSIKLTNTSEQLLPGKRGACNDVLAIFPRLKFVNLRGNKLRSLPKCLLYSWPVLEILNLNDNKFQSISHLNFANHLSHGSSLKELSLKRNRISTLTNRDLQTPSASLRGLVTLNLDENIISSIRSGMFMFLPELRDISLKDNLISIVPDYAFITSGHKVEEILLQRNRIRFLSQRAFAGLPQLRVVDISHNLISCITSTLATCAALPVQGTRFERNLRENLSSQSRFEVNFRSLVAVRVQSNPWRCDCRLRSLMPNQTFLQAFHPPMSSARCAHPSTMRDYYVTTVVEQLLHCEE